MANTRILFLGDDKTEGHELECFLSYQNNIYINIDMPNGGYSFICLDKPTAIKLHRELKKQISFIKD